MCIREESTKSSGMTIGLQLKEYARYWLSLERAVRISTASSPVSQRQAYAWLTSCNLLGRLCSQPASVCTADVRSGNPSYTST